MKKVLFSLISCLFLTTGLMAQDFDSAVGLRLGQPTSVSYKKFISETNALEGYVGFRSFTGASFITASAAYQIHKDIDEVDGLQWYYGAGGSVFLWTLDFGDGTTSFGVQGYIGLSYTFDGTPINLSVDWIPTLFINGVSGFGNGFGGGYGTFAVRYVLGGQDGA